MFWVILVLFPLAIATGTDNPCEVDGISHAHGATFTRTASGPCIIYRCDNGGYAPISIKCVSGGQCFDVGANKTTGCITQTCEQRNGSIGFYITKDGCLNGNDCLDVGESVVENCNSKTCVKTDTSYSLETIYSCKDNGNVCRPLGYVQESYGGCVKQTCESRSGNIGLHITQMECPYNGNCLAINATDKQGCLTRKCVHNADGSFGVVIDSFECLDGNVCRPIGYVRSSNNGCFEDTCQQNGTSYGFSSSKRECSYNNACVPVGESREEGCITRTCVLENNAYGMSITRNDCSTGNGSDASNAACTIGTEQLSDSGCIKYRCENRTEGISFYIIQTECSYDNACVPVGESREDSCITKTCTLGNNTIGMITTRNECSYNNACVPVGESREEGCITRTCVLESNLIGMSITRNDCFTGNDSDVSNGTCTIGTEQLSDSGCIRYRCENRPEGITFYAIQTDCSLNGQCIPVNGSATQNCTTYQCQKNGNTLSLNAVQVQCQFGGECVPVNATRTQSCITRQCQLRGNSIGMAITQIQCRDSNNICHDLGHQITQGCFEHTCESRAAGIGYYLTKEGCIDGTVCRDYGYSRTNPPGSCFKQTCEKRPAGVGFFNQEPECKDSDGTCKPLNTTKTYANGCIVKTCITTNLGTGFQTTTEGCDNGGVCISLNEYAPVSDCTTKQCQKQSNGAIGLVVTDLKCTDNVGNCHIPGGATFSYAFDDGTVSDNCSCTANIADITRKYTCV
ncbi:hypothetical protein SNE40_019529 [Patella caerulea]|uniref:Uncharacterized protein n=1 Tax=Patella caerulea TaxID=87958 RepID=A0AAN8P624_PATCE